MASDGLYLGGRMLHTIYVGFFVVLASAGVIAFLLTGEWASLRATALFGLIAYAVSDAAG